MKFVTAFQDPIRITKAVYYKLKPMPLPRVFKDATGGIRKSSLFGDWVQLFDADGNMGEGPCTNLMKEYFIPLLLQSETMTLNELRESLFWQIRNFGYQSFHVRELGALDMVLCDLIAVRNGKPLHRLLGAEQDWSNVYKGGGSVLLSDEELVDDILRFRSEGYHQTKIKVGGTDDWKDDIRRVEKIRKAVGEDFGIAVDSNQKWDVETAFDFMKEAAKLHVSWMEEPIHAYDMNGLKRLRTMLDDANVSVPIAMGESVRSYYEFEQYADHGVGHLQPANAALFCLDEYLKVASLAKERGLRISSGGITFENVALGACYGPEGFIEYHQPIMEVIAPYLSVSSRVEDGRFYLPEQPGIPMRMDFSHLEKDGLLGAREVFYR